MRPEQIRLGIGTVAARVSGVTFYGHDASVGLLLDGTPTAGAVPRASPAIARRAAARRSA